MRNLSIEFEPSEEDIKNIREWISKMPQIVQDYDDYIVKTVIIACKGRLQKTKEVFEKLNSIGYMHPYFSGHLDPLDETTQYYLNNAYMFVMPEKADDGSTVIITTSKLHEVDPSKYSVFEIARYILMTFYVLLWDNNLGSSKIIVVYDCERAKVSEMRNVTPVFLKDFADFCSALPIRFQAGHIVNVPRFFQWVLNTIKPLMYKKMSDRLYFHNSAEELHEIIPKKLLPNELGGDAGSLDKLQNLWKKKVESYRDRLILENDKMRKLDHLRSKSNGNGELEGSFRKIEMD